MSCIFKMLEVETAHTYMITYECSRVCISEISTHEPIFNVFFPLETEVKLICGKTL